MTRDAPPRRRVTLTVRSAQEERQLRRLGAAVSLIWGEIPSALRDRLLDQAAEVVISGETTSSTELRGRIEAFLDGDDLNI